MKYYSVLSIICLGIYSLLFSLMVNGVSFGFFGKLTIISMCLFPLVGIFYALKSRKRFSKWILIILNTLAFFTIIYLLVLGFGIGEK
ncbi:hypothetical protein [Metabacillus litoralis]|uniref:hypothetical protein n=1 Tax=Metabacillus litoralis TaxID=152268 RepID=UPI001CFC96DE|nr:hypothetical protein [Metabacillus litoralis]